MLLAFLVLLHAFFVLALLLGSTMVYNSPGPITDANLNTMSLVANLTKRLGQSCKGGVASVMPHLCWLCRDFSLKLEDEGGQPITPSQYLENAIQPTGLASKDGVRNTLRECFPSRSCATIVRPVIDEASLQGSILDSPHLRPEFVEQMQRQ